MMDGRLPLITGILFLLLTPATGHAEADIGKNVRFHLVDGNATIVTGTSYNYSTVRVDGDGVAFDGAELILSHPAANTILATLWQLRTGNEQTGQETVRIGTDTTDGDTVTFQLSGVLTDRDYKIEEDDTQFSTVPSGEQGVIIWDSDAWATAHNFSAIPLEALENITIELRTDFDHPGDTVVIDDTEDPAEGTYGSGDIDFGYGAVEFAERVAGIVPGTGILQLEYENMSTTYRFAQTQAIEDNIFFLPFTRGTHQDIEQRESVIQGGLFGPGNFLGFPSPNFGFVLTQKKTVRVSLTVDSLLLSGMEQDVPPGTYTLLITNQGEDGGEAVVSITVK